MNMNEIRADRMVQTAKMYDQTAKMFEKVGFANLIDKSGFSSG